MRTVVYTALFGGRDRLRRMDPARGCDHVVFTDDARLRSRTFEVVVCDRRFDDPTRDARFYKLHPHEVLPDHDRSLWIDANISLRAVDVPGRLDAWLAHHDLAAPGHPKRDCIYDEASACIRWNKDDPAVIRRQMAAYRARGYPEHNGLVSTGVLARRHSDEVASVDASWWAEVVAHSRRDQLSFPVAAWTVGVDYRVIDGNPSSDDLPGFRLHEHARAAARNW